MEEQEKTKKVPDYWVAIVCVALGVLLGMVIAFVIILLRGGA